MFRKTLYYCLVFITLYIPSTVNAESWHILAPGIKYQDLGSSLFTSWSHIHVFKIDLKRNQINLVMAGDLAHKQASAHDFARHTHALIAINGGFFDKDYHPLGLRINNQHQHNPLKQISWWGIFYIKNQTAHLSSLREYKHDLNVDFAVQTGPRLLVNGKIMPLKQGFAERTALGITKDGQVIILVTENTPMNTTNLASILKTPPLNCIDALNLDGGSSTQLYAHIGSFKINAPSFAYVTDGIVVQPRN